MAMTEAIKDPPAGESIRSLVAGNLEALSKPPIVPVWVRSSSSPPFTMPSSNISPNHHHPHTQHDLPNTDIQPQDPAPRSHIFCLPKRSCFELIRAVPASVVQRGQRFQAVTALRFRSWREVLSGTAAVSGKSYGPKDGARCSNVCEILQCQV